MARDWIIPSQSSADQSTTADTLRAGELSGKAKDKRGQITAAGNAVDHLPDELADDLRSIDVCQPFTATIMPIVKILMIQAEQMQNRGVVI